MNLRFTALLFLALVLGLGGLLAWLLLSDDARRDGRLLESLAGLKADEIDTVEITRLNPEPETVVLARSEGQWEIRKGGQGRLIPREVDAVINAVLKLKPVPSKLLTDNPANHGLDNPTYKITLRSRDQRSGTLHLGTTTIGGDDAITFVADGDRPDVPLALDAQQVDDLFAKRMRSKKNPDGSEEMEYRSLKEPGPAAPGAKWLPDFRLRQLLGIELRDAMKEAKSIRLATRGLELGMTRGPNGWTFDTINPPPPAFELGALAGTIAMAAEFPYPAEGPVDELGDRNAQPSVITGLRHLMTALTGTVATDPDDFLENPGPLVDYGLDDRSPRLIRIAITDKNDRTEELLLGDKVKNETGRTEFEKYYARIPGHKEVIKVFGGRTEALRKTISNPSSIQDRMLLKEEQAIKLDAIDSIAGGETAKLRKIGDSWAIYGGPGDPQKASATIVRMIDAATTPRLALESYPMADALFAPANLQSEWKFWCNGLAEKAAMKDGKLPAEPVLKGLPTMTLLLAKPNRGTAALRRILADGSKTDFLVPSEFAEFATGTRLSHLDLQFKSFLPNDVTKVQIQRGGKVFEIERTAFQRAQGPWVFLLPPEWKNYPAGRESIGTDQPGAGILGILGTLSAASAVTEKPTPEQLVAFGLDPLNPRLSVKLTFANGTSREYLFGKNADDGHAYARTLDTLTVYRVPKVGVDAILGEELRSPVPFDLNEYDITSIRLAGWKNAGKRTELVLTKKGEIWETNAVPPNQCTLKVQEFLKYCRAPRALKVIGTQDPKHGFAHELEGNDPLEIAFTAKDGKRITLTLGKPTPDGSALYAWASSTDCVYEFPLTAFQSFRNDPDYFRK